MRQACKCCYVPTSHVSVHADQQIVLKQEMRFFKVFVTNV